MDSDMQAVLAIMGCGFVGVIFAAILKILNDQGTMIDEFITGTITITDLMAIVIIIFLLVGVIIAVVKR